MKIIGLTGSYAAGKDTVADFLVKKGFSYYSLSDLLRQELKKDGKKITRDQLIAKGNEMRIAYGAGVLAERIVKKLREEKPQNAVVVSIRNPDEVKFLKTEKEFELWFVDAPLKMRFERAKKRMRPEDEVGFDQFKEQEKLENSEDAKSQQLDKVALLADETIMNDSHLESLFGNVEVLLKK